MTNNLKKHGIFLILAVLFMAPGIAAYIVYQHPNWLTRPKINKGMLLKPPVALNALEGSKKWKLIFWSPASCQQKCLKGMDRIARVRLALGRKLYQVDQFLLVGSDVSLSKSTQTQLKKEDVQWIALSKDDTTKLSGITPKAALFLASPDNYLILTYAHDVNPDDVYRDIKLLINSTEQKNA